MAGLLDFLFGQGGQGLLAGYGGPAYPNGGAGAVDPSQIPAMGGSQAMAQAGPMMQPQGAPDASGAASPQLPQMGAAGMLSMIAPRFGNPLIQRQTTQIMLQGLMQKGFDAPTAIAIASNPKLQEQLLGAPTQMGSYKQQDGSEIPLYSQGGSAPKLPPFLNGQLPPAAPKPVTYKNPTTGLEGTAVYDGGNKAWNDIISGRPLADAQPNLNGSASPYAPSAPPPGVDIGAWRKAQATKIVGDEQKLREQADGSIQFIPDALRVLGRVQGPQGKDAIGPYQGGPIVNGYIRPALGAIPGDPLGSGRALGDYNTLKADIQRLSSTGLKAQFGARPTNVEVQMNNQTFGGLQAADQGTAANILKERIQNSYANLNRGVQHGFIKPEAVPPDVVQYGVQNGFLDPNAFGMSAPAKAAAPAAQPSGGLPAGWSVKVR